MVKQRFCKPQTRVRFSGAALMSNRNCPICNNPLKRSINKYCSNKCQARFGYNEYIRKWKKGLVIGSRGIVAKNISGHIKRYLADKFGEKCVLCGWRMKNPITGKVTVEIDHIERNSENNTEQNRRMICPNCHSLSPNFRNLNKGKGRSWRMAKYLKSGAQGQSLSQNCR